MEDKRYWYAVMADENDDWFYGSVDFEEAKQMTKNLSPTAFISVVDYTDLRHQFVVKEIHQNEF